MEQADVHALGSTPRASDSRILMSLILNSGIVVAMYLISDFANAIILGVVLAWIFSHNFTFGLGMVSPHEVINEKLQQQKDYSDIVFSKHSGQQLGSSLKESICTYVTGVIFKTILCGGITIALNIIVVKGVILFAE